MAQQKQPAVGGSPENSAAIRRFLKTLALNSFQRLQEAR
jgi:hypothetical protein